MKKDISCSIVIDEECPSWLQFAFFLMFSEIKDYSLRNIVKNEGVAVMDSPFSCDMFSVLNTYGMFNVNIRENVVVSILLGHKDIYIGSRKARCMSLQRQSIDEQSYWGRLHRNGYRIAWLFLENEEKILVSQTKLPAQTSLDLQDGSEEISDELTIKTYRSSTFG